MRRHLEYQADQIEMVLASHRVPARVTGGLVTPVLVRFELLTALPARLGKIANLEEELATRLGPWLFCYHASVCFLTGISPSSLRIA
jgi:DNA segregation ATPase FtsK/SpoIIIE-like protein